jgi:rhamnosyltransferase
MQVYKDKIMAGIVLYNPEIDLLENNIKAIINNVDCVYLYDNASKNYNEIEDLISKFNNVVYKRGSENEGIAKGLNQILNYATDNGYEWYLTMDQDSICSDNLVDEYRKYMCDSSVGLVCTVLLNNGKLTMEEYENKNLPDFEYIQKPIDCITSACMNNTKIVNDVGGYPEDYFIDYVDVDLNCRVLLAGYKIVRANRAYLIQHMGEGRRIRLFTKLYHLTKWDALRRMQVASVYSDLRLYYSARNSRIVSKRYENAGFRVSPFFMFLLFCYFTITYPKERNRISMWKNIYRGYADSKRKLKTLAYNNC